MEVDKDSLLLDLKELVDRQNLEIIELNREILIFKDAIKVYDIPLKEENQILRKALNYYKSPESITFHTDVAVKAIYDADQIRAGK